MTTVRQALAAILADAADLELGHAVIGGLAVSTWTEPRTTRDVDLAVSVEDDVRAEASILALQQRGYLVDAVVEQQTIGRLATARLRPPGARSAGALVDLLFASSGVEPEVVAGAQSIYRACSRRSWTSTAAPRADRTGRGTSGPVCAP